MMFRPNSPSAKKSKTNPKDRYNALPTDIISQVMPYLTASENMCVLTLVNKNWHGSCRTLFHLNLTTIKQYLVLRIELNTKIAELTNHHDPFSPFVYKPKSAVKPYSSQLKDIFLFVTQLNELKSLPFESASAKEKKQILNTVVTEFSKIGDNPSTQILNQYLWCLQKYFPILPEIHFNFNSINPLFVVSRILDSTLVGFLMTLPINDNTFQTSINSFSSWRKQWAFLEKIQSLLFKLHMEIGGLPNTEKKPTSDHYKQFDTILRLQDPATNKQLLDILELDPGQPELSRSSIGGKVEYLLGIIQRYCPLVGLDDSACSPLPLQNPAPHHGAGPGFNNMG